MTKPTTAQLAVNFVSCSMNCDKEHNPTKILRLLGSDLNDIAALKKFFSEEKERLDKKGPHEFSHWYDKDIISHLNELIKQVKKENNTGRYDNDIVGEIIIRALKEGHMFQKFNWNNYYKLLQEKMFSLFSEFDTDFRGDIITCHNVADKYVVIETERYPFDKQRYKTQEPKEKHFYSTEVRGGILRTTSTMFHTFEAALFHTMNSHQYSAMNILFESKKD